MTNQVDELFGARPPEPPRPSPLRGLQIQLVLAALLLLIGPCCFTSVPGALFAIWVWTRCDETLTLVDNGVLPLTERAMAQRLRSTAFLLMGWAAATILVQVIVYGQLGTEGILTLAQALLQGLGGILNP